MPMSDDAESTAPLRSSPIPGLPSNKPMGGSDDSGEDTDVPPDEAATEPAAPGEPNIDDLDDIMDADDLGAEEYEQQMQDISKKINYSDPDIMRAFYQRLFPFRFLFQWLNHSMTPTADFYNREFAFTLQNDSYLRYQAFPTADLLRRQCADLLPSRFEIGPVYSTNPTERRRLPDASAFKPISKELVFDIDMTDYDPIRTCCTGANICSQCWVFITMAIKVVDAALRDDFGFEHILWVYSGRRGAHAWVCDRRARDLDDAQRKAITGYLVLLQDSSMSERKVNLKRPLHPHVERSLELLKGHFQNNILNEQDPWASPEKAEKLAKLLSTIPALSSVLSKKWTASPDRSSSKKWADIDAEAKTLSAASFNPQALLEAKQDIVLEYTYARLDAGVSKKRNHLLKSPFVVHPGTGRVCVPIDMSDYENFDPFAVPTVTTLLDQIDQWDRKNKEMADGDGPTTERKVQDWEKTDLKPYINYFRSFISKLIKDEQATKRAREDDDSMDF